MCNYFSGQAWCAIYYSFGSPVWYSGTEYCTFQVINAYLPLINHPAISRWLVGVSLGTDMELPTHALVVNMETFEVYLAEYSEAVALCKYNATVPETEATLHPEEIAFKKGFLGFLPAMESEEINKKQLIQWLNQFVTPERVFGRTNNSQNVHHSELTQGMKLSSRGSSR